MAKRHDYKLPPVEKYELRRRFDAGSASTLRKTAKLYRLRGEAPEPTRKQRMKHPWWRKEYFWEALRERQRGTT